MHQDSAHTTKSSKFFYIYIGVIVGLTVIFSDKIKSLAPMFQLTQSDLSMIPVGIVFFLVFWKLSERFLFNPFIELIDAREAATSGSESESIEISDQAQKLLDDTEAKLFGARGRAVRDREDQLNKVRATCTLQITEANTIAKSKVDQQRIAIAKEAEALRDALNVQIDNLAREVVERIKSGPKSEAQNV